MSARSAHEAFCQEGGGDAMRRMLQRLAVVLALAGAACPAVGAPPRVEAMPDRDYPVTPQAGPWLICAASYTGPEAPELARQLVLWIRTQHNMPAYVFNHADEERRKQQEELNRIQEQYPEAQIRRRTIRVEEQCAVLVGGYKDLESAQAQVQMIRKWPEPQFQLRPGVEAFDTVLRREGDKVEAVKVSPYANAFPTRNPTLPRDPKPVAKADPL